jgi:hypothetical protein
MPVYGADIDLGMLVVDEVQLARVEWFEDSQNGYLPGHRAQCPSASLDGVRVGHGGNNRLHKKLIKMGKLLSIRFRSRPPYYRKAASADQPQSSRPPNTQAISGMPHIAVFLAFLLWPLLAIAELAPKDAFPPLSLPDQYGEQRAITAETRLVLFAADRPASDVLNGFLKAQPGDLLAQRRAEYVADISSMPALITRLVALPRMRERPYRILLVEEASMVDFLPRQPSAVTVLRLTEGSVDEVLFAESENALAEILGVP